MLSILRWDVVAKTTVATSNGTWDDPAVWDNGVPDAGDDAGITNGVSVLITNATPSLASFVNYGTIVFTN